MVSAAAVRKTVSVVFCDLAGSTALGERLDPEPLRALMGGWYEAMRDAVDRHGGTVEKFIGDAVMALFGVPAAHEDDALRAVRAALDMQAGTRALGQGLSVRVGVNTGEVVTGEGAATLATGDAVNTARRLQEAAAPGEILIGQMTRRLVGHAARLEPVPPVTAKGKREAVSAWRVLEASSDADAFARRSDTPLVGRQRELSLLRSTLEEVAARRSCRLVTVLGTAGVGKSRLCDELAADAHDRATVLSGRCLPYGDGITYWPLTELIRDLGGERAVREAVQAEPDAPLIEERLRVLTGRGTATPEELFWAVRRLFEALAAGGRPLVVRLEDLHWAEPTLLDLVEHVSRWSRGAPILLLCLARPELLETRPDWEGALVRLDPLSLVESSLLLDALSADAPLPPAVRARVTETAQGNPLYVEQLVAMLAEDGTEAGSPALPPTIQALLAARLDRLDPHERDVLERAAVVGKEFWPGAVAALGGGGEEQLGATLLRLLHRELVEPAASRFPGEDGFRFRHALIREAAYAAAPKVRRADHHERFVTWLGAVGADGEPFDEIVGYHLEQACRLRSELSAGDRHVEELAARAHERLARAGDRAYDRGDAPAARSLLGRALELDAGRDGTFELRRRLAHVLWETGDGERAIAAADALVEDAFRSGDRAAEWYARLDAAGMRGAEGLVAFLETAAQAVEVFSELGDERGLAQAWRRISIAERVRCSYGAAQAAAERALLYARRCADRRDAARAADVLGTALLWGPAHVDEGLARCRALLAGDERDGPLRANVFAALGGLQAMQGETDAARASCSAAERIYTDLGLRMSIAGLTQVTAQVELSAGEPAAAEAQARRGLELVRGTAVEPFQLALLATALAASGRHDEAVEAAVAARGLAGTGDVHTQVLWRGALARAEAGRGASADALPPAREAVDLAALTDGLPMHADALAHLAAVHAAAGSEDDAQAAAAEAGRLHERKGNVAGVRTVRAELAEPHRQA